jgi:hypothetical protein
MIEFAEWAKPLKPLIDKELVERSVRVTASRRSERPWM